MLKPHKVMLCSMRKSFCISSLSIPIFLFLVLSVVTAGKEKEDDHRWIFAVVAKSTSGNAFFDVVHEGCTAKAAELGVRCLFVGPKNENAEEQARIIDYLVDYKDGAVKGIAFATIDQTTLFEPVKRAIDAGIRVVTFDSDAPDTLREAYIGTNNTAFGEELAKVLLQLDPDGSNWGKIGFISGAGPNLGERVAGLRARVQSHEVHWEEADGSPTDCLDSVEVALDQMYMFAKDPEIRAIVPVGGWPMYNSTGWIEFVQYYRREIKNKGRNLTLVVGDSLDIQIQLLNKGYAQGLVGQLPYEMGELSISTLYTLVQGKTVEQVIFGTELLQILRVPLILPALTVNKNYIGNLKILGYFLYAIILAASLGCLAWTLFQRKNRVVMASQPFFLIMICIGCLLMGSVLIPLTVEDENTQKESNIACMSIPWLLTLGSTITFSALFSKTWRLNKIFYNSARFTRVVVTKRDVLLPFFVIFSCNIIVLLCWSVLSPPEWKRYNHEGTDPWNRVISTYGTCFGPATNGTPYFITLMVIALVVLIISNYQAYVARWIRTEFGESRSIGISMLFMLQVVVVGTPVLVLIRDSPQTTFVVFSLMVAIVCLATIISIFMPKISVVHRLTRSNNSDFRSNTISSTNGGGFGLKLKMVNASNGVSFPARSSLPHSVQNIDPPGVPSTEASVNPSGGHKNSSDAIESDE